MFLLDGQAILLLLAVWYPPVQDDPLLRDTLRHVLGTQHDGTQYGEVELAVF